MGSGTGSGRNGGPMDARAQGVGAPGATPCRGKPLGGTGSALDHGGVAGFNGYRPCRPLSRYRKAGRPETRCFSAQCAPK